MKQFRLSLYLCVFFYSGQLNAHPFHMEVSNAHGLSWIIGSLLIVAIFVGGRQLIWSRRNPTLLRQLRNSK